MDCSTHRVQRRVRSVARSVGRLAKGIRHALEEATSAPSITRSLVSVGTGSEGKEYGAGQGERLAS